MWIQVYCLIYVTESPPYRRDQMEVPVIAALGDGLDPMFYAASWKPATDLFRSGNDWLIKMELAGVSPAEVQLHAKRNVLHVQGRRRDVSVQSGYTCHRLEISYTNFERSITLPSVIDAGCIRTEYHDGILRIYLRTL